jgi:hypothetical protein
MIKRTVVTMLFILPLYAATAQTCSKHSPGYTVALLELYTSEGCSSCPPADRAISALQNAAGADQVVPLGLHVDYWDDIGWKDKFAKAGFTRRQEWLTGLSGGRTIYTPEIFIGGREMREWQTMLPTAIRDINRRTPRADIHITLAAPGSGKLPVEIEAKAPLQAMLYIALYEMGLSSQVAAGENRGVFLRHDYVVRDWLGPIGLESVSRDLVSVTRTLAIPPGANPKNLGVAAFVEAGDGEALQALAMPLCRGM